METFGARLHAAMLAAGMETPALLAKSCGVPQRTIKTWLGMEEADVSAALLFKAATCLRVRMRWLIAGKGVPPMAGVERRDLVDETFDVLDHLEPQAVKTWIAMARKLIKAQ